VSPLVTATVSEVKSSKRLAHRNTKRRVTKERIRELWYKIYAPSSVDRIKDEEFLDEKEVTSNIMNEDRTENEPYKTP
jgi:hypothetical protein